MYARTWCNLRSYSARWPKLGLIMGGAALIRRTQRRTVECGLPRDPPPGEAGIPLNPMPQPAPALPAQPKQSRHAASWFVQTVANRNGWMITLPCVERLDSFRGSEL